MKKLTDRTIEQVILVVLVVTFIASVGVLIVKTNQNSNNDQVYETLHEDFDASELAE